MGVQGNNEWEMPNNPTAIQVFKLFTKENPTLIKSKLKAAKVNEQVFQSEMDKVFKSIALQTERGQFSSIALMKTDLLGIGNGLQVHCLTTADDLTAVVLVNAEYNKNFGKKFLSNVILEFRDFFASDPSIYQGLMEDQPDWDQGLYPDSLEMIWDKWQNPD